MSGLGPTANSSKTATRIILKHAVPLPDCNLKNPSQIALEAVKLAAKAFASGTFSRSVLIGTRTRDLNSIPSGGGSVCVEIAHLVHPFPNGIDPKEALLCVGGSLGGQESYMTIVLSLLKTEFGWSLFQRICRGGNIN